jgi:hypothetical protein
VNVTLPGGSSSRSDGLLVEVAPENELAEGELLGRPRRRRCVESIRTAKSAKKTTKAIEEP